MIKNLLKILIIISIGITQVTLMPNLSILGIWPNLLLILVIMLVFFNADQEALLSASLGGLILDLSSPIFFGFFTVFLVANFLVIRFVTNRFLDEPNLAVALLVLFLNLLICDSFISLLNRQFNFGLIIINSFYGIAIGVIFYQLLSIWIDNEQSIKLK